MTMQQIKNDLKDIQYYYARKNVFDKASTEVGNSTILELINKYHAAICSAPPKLYDIYVSLYVHNNTQETLSVELNYSPDYVHKLNDRLCKFFLQQLSV